MVTPLKLFGSRPLAVLQHRRQPVSPHFTLAVFAKDHEGGLPAEFDGGLHAHQEVIIVAKGR